METNHFSASELVKCSAAQIKWNKQEKQKALNQGLQLPVKAPSERMIRGNEWASSRIKSPYVEMGGPFRHTHSTIWFSMDEVRVTPKTYKFIEHKMVETNPEEWFFYSSVIQTAFYGAMLGTMESIKTAKFYKGEHHQLYIADKKHVVQLHFGEDVYNIKFDSVQVIRFFLTKAKAIQSDWATAKQFDVSWKKKEWEWFVNYVTYKKVNRVSSRRD